MATRILNVAALLAILWLPGTEALAQNNPNNVLDNILGSYQAAAAGWSATIVSLATGLFTLLAAIEFAWMGIRLAIHGADLQTWAGEIIQRIMFIGLFLFLLLNAGFATEIVNSFRQSAAISSGLGSQIYPSQVLEMGLDVALRITESVTIRDIPGSLGLIFTGLIMTIAFALMAALLLLAIVEMYILINAGVILLGFGGSSFTKDVAIRFLTYTVSVGAKLFVMQLVIGLGMTLLLGFTNSFDAAGAEEQALVMLGVAITFLALVRSLPDMVQSIINGVAVGGSGGLIPAAAATGSVAGRVVGGAARGGFGVGHAISEASKLATAQNRPGLAGTMSNAAGAMTGALANKLTGTPGSSFGTTAGRAVDQMRQQRDARQGQAGSQPHNSPALNPVMPTEGGGNRP